MYFSMIFDDFINKTSTSTIGELYNTPIGRLYKALPIVIQLAHIRSLYLDSKLPKPKYNLSNYIFTAYSLIDSISPFYFDASITSICFAKILSEFGINFPIISFSTPYKISYLANNVFYQKMNIYFIALNLSDLLHKLYNYANQLSDHEQGILAINPAPINLNLNEQLPIDLAPNDEVVPPITKLSLAFSTLNVIANALLLIVPNAPISAALFVSDKLLSTSYKFLINKDIQDFLSSVESHFIGSEIAI